MDTTTELLTRIPITSFSRSRRVAGGISALALTGLGVAHTATNAVGFAADTDASWSLFLVFGVGISVVLWAFAVVVWRYARRGAGPGARVVVLAAGILCCALALIVLRGHPELALIPAGPGPWALIGGPALLVTAALPPRKRPSGRSR
ncbi:hypothetical protein [Microbacterium sp. NPDC057650]|uniref:hypothetical protein n=1 Tax=unclassified Microbacterium TaxID=2609290 RepID=UPI00366F2ED3